MERLLEKLESAGGMMPGSLRELLTEVIDYAGLFPPAGLPLAEVTGNYRRYRLTPHAWLLNRLVLPGEKLREVELESDWHVSAVVNGEPGPLPQQVECLETRSGGRLSLPTYCEAPLETVRDGYAKIRTIGLSADDLAEFLYEAAQRRVAFKATAGLHHPMRADTHGFLNLFAAAIFAWRGMDRTTLRLVLNETDPAAFIFLDEEMQWREWRATAADVRQIRQDFAHSFGSCSFEEPVEGLRALGLFT